jgi:threonine aldolase
MSAEMLGKEAAVFTPSGTMSNLISVLAQTRPGDEIIIGSESHMFWYEVGGAAALGGVVMRTVTNDDDGRLDPSQVEQAIRGKNVHFPVTTFIALENTHNRCGGAVLTKEYTQQIADIAHRHGMKLHLDGARIFNAAVYLNAPARELTQPVDSVCFCISKGLSCPVGSLLCGSKEFIGKARKWRKMLGGGMRQVGVIAAAGIVALETMIDRLAEDHINARKFAEGLAQIPGFKVEPAKVKTNIVVFESPATMADGEFVKEMMSRDVKMGNRGSRMVRAVTHRMISAADIDEALKRISQFAREKR